MLDLTSIKILSDSEKIMAKAFGYRLISLFFLHPRERSQRIDWTFEIDWSEMIQIWGMKDPESIKKKMQTISDELQINDFEKQKLEYENIFGHTACSKAPLYELEYGQEHSHRQPQELADITGFYEAFGFKCSKKSHERPDHISIECEFLYVLLYKQALALKKNVPDHANICQASYKRFLQDHLAYWFPALVYRISKFSPSGLIYNIAEFSHEFITNECDKLGVRSGSESLGIRPIEEKVDSGCISCQLGPQSAAQEINKCE